jgi:hypothetical protein
MKIFLPLINFHNWLSDKDFIWWPFSFLRPEKHEPITFKHTLLMTGCFGGFAFLAFSIMAVMNNALTFDYVVSLFVTSFAGFFTWFNLVTKPLWNVRARAFKK